MKTVPLWLRAPRSTILILVAVVLLVAIGIASPVQLPVVLYKATLICLAAAVGYWLDRFFFPYARPDGYLKRDWRIGRSCEGVDYPVAEGYEQTFNQSMNRRALVVAATIIGFCLAL